MLFMKKTSVKVVVFGLMVSCSLFSCGKPSSRRMQNENSPSTKKSGIDALVELKQMAITVPIGSSCQLSSTSEDLTSWSFQQRGRDSQILTLQADEISSTTAERVNRDSVPYWRISGQMKSSSGETVNLQWQVREDQDETTGFSLIDEAGTVITELKQCQL